MEVVGEAIRKWNCNRYFRVRVVLLGLSYSWENKKITKSARPRITWGEF